MPDYFDIILVDVYLQDYKSYKRGYKDPCLLDVAKHLQHSYCSHEFEWKNFMCTCFLTSENRYLVPEMTKATKLSWEEYGNV